MPRTKAAVKRVKTSERNRLKNVSYKTKIKTLTKKILDSIVKKDLTSATKSANEVFALIDRIATKKIIHRNSAARKKSRISKWLKSLDKSSR